MKTILVLTDFSKSAKNAAEVAVNMAERLKANIVLFNVYLSPVILPSAEAEIWPLDDDGALHLESDVHLNEEAGRIQHIIERADKHLYKPTIYCMSAEGALAENVRSVFKEKNVLLIIMGSRERQHSAFFAASNINAVVNKVDKPVLIIPENCRLADIKSVAFATDVAKGDIQAIRWLAKISSLLKFKIYAGHVTEPDPNRNLREEYLASEFMSALAKLSSKSVHFHHIRGHNVITELKRFTEATKADILALVHKKHSFVWRMFNESTSKDLIADPKMPLLIIPEGI